MLIRTTHLFCLIATLACANSAMAQAVPLDDAEMGQVWGQAMMELTNTSAGGQDFSRITLNADVALSANFKEMQLGKYNAAIEGTGYDIDIKALQFGRNPDVVPVGGDAVKDRVVRITNPYFEFVYKNGSDSATREVIGMRMGFQGIDGYLGTQIRSLSGSVKAGIAGVPVVTTTTTTDPDTGVTTTTTTSTPTVMAFDSGTGTKRSDGTAAGTINPVLLSTVGEFKLGNADGATRDFFIGVQSQDVTYPTVAGVDAPTAGAGFWLNMRDRVSGTVGDMPANQLRPAAAVKW